jgi:hypothetical protein
MRRRLYNPGMACLIGCLALAFPRLLIVLLVIFSDYIGHAYASVFVPLLGFVFMPFTTLAYAFAINTNHGTVDSLYLVLVVLTVRQEKHSLHDDVPDQMIPDYLEKMPVAAPAHNVSEPTTERYHRPPIGGGLAARHIAVASQGQKSWTVWHGYDPDSRQDHVYAQSFDGADRGATHCLTTTSGDHGRPSICCDPTDQLNAVWITNGKQLVGATIHSDRVNPTNITIHQAEALRDPHICRDSNGIPWCSVITSDQQRESVLLFQREVSDQWKLVGKLDLEGYAGRPDLHVDHRGNILLACDCYVDKRYHVEVWQWADIRWTKVHTIINQDAHALQPRMTRCANNSLWLCWLRTAIVRREGVASHGNRIRVARCVDDAWQNIHGPKGIDVAKLHTALLPKKRYFGYNGLRRNPRLIATDDGCMHLAWEAQRDEREVWDNLHNGHLLAMTYQNEAWSDSHLWHDGGVCFAIDRQTRHRKDYIPLVYVKTESDFSSDVAMTIAEPSRAAPFPIEQSPQWENWEPLTPHSRSTERAVLEHADQTYQLYWGDFHCHSIFSPDAEGDPDELYHFARDIAGIDFSGITDNDYYPDKALLSSELTYLQQLSRRLESTNTFIPFYGYEWTFHRHHDETSYNHRSIVFCDDQGKIVRRNEKAGQTQEAFSTAMKNTNAFFHAHHGIYDLLNMKQEANVEVASGWMANIEKTDTAHDQLNRGRRFGFIGGDDSHRMVPGMSGALVAVWARELARPAIIEALQHRRCYATAGARMMIDFRANDCLMGSVIPWTGPVQFKLDVSAPDSLKCVSLIRGGEIIHEFDCTDLTLNTTWIDPSPPPEGAWYYLRIEDRSPYREHPHNVCQATGPWAWSSPIWLEPK